jgi:hypothetical protein
MGVDALDGLQGRKADEGAGVGEDLFVAEREGGELVDPQGVGEIVAITAHVWIGVLAGDPEDIGAVRGREQVRKKAYRERR